MDINMTRPDNATLQMLRNPAIAFALPVVYSLVALVSIPGNCVSLWVLCRHIGPRSPSLIFMMNLSLTDLALATALPFQIHYHCNGNHWVFGPRLCTAVTVVFYANMYSSVLTMAFISVDRYLGVVRPLASAPWRRRRRYAVAACALAWCALLAALSPLARADLTYAVRDLGILTCFDVLQASMLPSVAAWALFLFTLFAALFLVPFAVTVGCYAATIRTLLRSAAAAESSEEEGEARAGGGAHGRRRRWRRRRRRRQQQTRRAVSLASVVLLSFVACFAPNNLALLAHVVSRLFLGKSYYHVYKLTLCLSCLNNCLDPFVYYFASREFQLRLRGYWGARTSSSASASSGSPQRPLPPPSARDARGRQESARTLSAPSVSSCPADGLPEEVAAAARPFLERQESVF